MTEPKTVVEIVKETANVTSYIFRDPTKEKNASELRLEMLITLITPFHIEDTQRNRSNPAEGRSILNENNPLKYICIGKTAEYREIATTTMQPFRTLCEAVEYGKSLLLKESFSGQKYYGSFIIQPLLEGTNSFVMTTDEINKILELEAAILEK